MSKLEQWDDARRERCRRSAVDQQSVE